ncbi:unnamed protein product [Litomosoides sigmodontis]|uniref:MAM domain-containing protein n=1 Tax=Litomosoides sigmodontis TaxID=42156 RepID=A0A3P6TFK9_LITSI|nr:unnamed protein product [Litomosoides sigmodontis]
MKSTALNINAKIRRANLSCNFDDGTLCGWRSDTDLWLIGVNVPINSFQFIPHHSNTNGFYAYAKGGRVVLAEGHLISAEVEEYDGSRKMLSFSYWKSNNISKLDVCIVQQNAFICIYTVPDTFHNEFRWIKQQITLSNNLSTTFKVVFRARNIHTSSDIVAIDDIEYRSASSDSFAPSISRNEIWRKILPNKATIHTSCIPIRCTFLDSTCAWTLEAPWHHLDGNITIDSEGVGLAKTGLFPVPVGAFFEMDVSISDNSSLAVLDNVRNELIWNLKGPYNENGQYRLRIPVKASKELIQLLLKGIVPSNNFVTVSNAKLVNAYGNEIGCGMISLNSMRPHFNNAERLTAFQQLYANQILRCNRLQVKPTTVILEERADESKSALANNIIQAQKFYSGIPFVAPMISSNYNLSFDPKIKEKIGKFLNNQSALPFKIINGLSVQRHHKADSLLPLLPFRQHGGVNQKSAIFTQPSPNKSYTERPVINQQHTRSNIKPGFMDELNSLLSQIAGHPALEMQLRQLAQRFRFKHINPEQRLELLKNVVNSKGLQSKIADLSVGTDRQPEPIRPINAPPQFIPAMQLFPYNSQVNPHLLFLPNELQKEFLDESEGLFGQNLSDETVKRWNYALSFLHPSNEA